MDFSTVVYILFFSLLDTLKPFLILIINKIILSDATDPSCHFYAMLTNEISDNLSLLGDGCSLLTLG
jgi:hypothetical protein